MSVSPSLKSASMLRFVVFAMVFALASCATARANEGSAPTELESQPSHWKGIPLPPGAKPYREVANGLMLVASASPPIEGIERWYMQTLANDGWKGEVTIRSDTPPFGDRFVSIDFRKDKRVMTVLLTNIPKEGIVMLQLAWKNP